MRVDDRIKKCVCFVALKKADGSFALGGTAFFIGRSLMSNGNGCYVVTAKHVLEGIKNKGLDKIFLRVNLKNGEFGHVETELNKWVYHHDANSDVAVYPIGMSLNDQISDSRFVKIHNVNFNL